MHKRIAALYVLTDGPYFNVPGVEPWDEDRDARKYRGPHPVIAHPPCERWGRYATGGPSASYPRQVGDDDGCFEAALLSVRIYGGVLEHPEASKAFHHFGLPIPKWHGGWTKPDIFGGRSACVAQGHYGHQARKMTWLYLVGVSERELPKLRWGPSKSTLRLDEGFHSAEERRRAIKTGVGKRLSARQRKLTPEPFKEVLLEIARSVTPLNVARKVVD